MPSQISPTAINIEFPYSGVNNNTQGFRNNFTATQTNFIYAQQDINDLLNKVVVTAPLNNGSAVVSNNLNGMPLIGPVLSWFSFAVVNHGILTTTAAETFDFSQGFIHNLTLNGAGAVTSVTPTNIPASGAASINIQVSVTNITHQLNMNQNNLVALNVPGFNSTINTLSFNAVGNYFYTLSTPDNGTHWQLTAQNSLAQAQSYTPATSKGVPGDTAGMIAYNSGNIYICTATYNGITNIWKTASLLTF